MRAVCVKGFRDLERRAWVAEGEVVEASPERLDAINSTRYGRLIEPIANGASERGSAPERADYAELTVAELRAALAERGVEVPYKARKADMVALLEAEDAR